MSLLLFHGVAATTEAAAGVAAGTGAAVTSLANVGVNGASASGIGTAAFGVSSSLNASSGYSVGTSDAYQPVAGVDSGALPEVATATGSAANATISLKPTAQAALGTESLVALATDAFGRTVASGLGTADSGQAWTTTGTASAYNVGSGVATFDHTSTNQARRAWLSSVIAHDVDQTFKVKAPAPTTSNHDIFIQLRQTSADGDYLMPKLRIGTDLSMTLSLNRRAVGVETELATVTLPNTFEADTYYTIRSRLLGQGLFAKAWKSVDSEPGWQVQASDTQIDAPGGIGMRTYSLSGTYPFSFTWDDLDSDEISGSQAYDAAPVPQTFTYAIASAAVGTGSVNDSFAALNAPLQAASGTGSVSTPSFTTAASIEPAEGTGASYDSVNAQNVNAGLSSGTGTAWQLSAATALGSDIAEAFADAYNLTFGLGAAPVIAAGSGVAYSATPLISPSVNVSPATAAGTGVAYDVTALIVQALAGFGTIGFRAASGAMTFRSATANMTIGGH